MCFYHPEKILSGYVRVAPCQGAFPRVLIPRPEGLGYWSVAAWRSWEAQAPPLQGHGNPKIVLVLEGARCSKET
jgi:hypothetical protein